MKHVSGWLAAQGLAVGDLSVVVVVVVERFVADCRRRYRSMRSMRALVPMLRFLRRVGVVPTPLPSAPAGPVGEVATQFADYLRTRRGLAAATVNSYVSQVVVFLRWRAERYGTDWGSLAAGQVHEFVTVRAQGQRPRSVQVGVNALRSLLRWMGAQQLAAAGLAESLGPVAPGTMAVLPKALNDVQVRQLLAGLPATGVVRLRNEAILAMLWRLGLSCGAWANQPCASWEYFRWGDEMTRQLWLSDGFTNNYLEIDRLAATGVMGVRLDYHYSDRTKS